MSDSETCENCKHWKKAIHIKFGQEEFRGKCVSEKLLEDYRTYFGDGVAKIVETAKNFWCRYYEESEE